MVLQFVGFMAAYRDPGLSPLLAATLGGLLATWVTFTPCFLWIFLGAPLIEKLRGNRALAALFLLSPPRWWASSSIWRSGLRCIRSSGRPRRCARSGCRSTCRCWSKPRYRGLRAGGGRGDRDLPPQHRDAVGAGRLVRGGRGVAAGGDGLSHLVGWVGAKRYPSTLVMTLMGFASLYPSYRPAISPTPSPPARACRRRPLISTCSVAW